MPQGSPPPQKIYIYIYIYIYICRYRYRYRYRERAFQVEKTASAKARKQECLACFSNRKEEQLNEEQSAKEDWQMRLQTEPRATSRRLSQASSQF